MPRNQPFEFSAGLRIEAALWGLVGGSEKTSEDLDQEVFNKKCVGAWLLGDERFPPTMHSLEALSMNTSQKKPFLSEVLNGEKIPLGTLSYFRERFRDRLYDLVMEEFLKQDAETGLTRAEVARRIDRRPEQITRWFGAPGNWTLETVSDLLLAIARSEPDVRLLPLEGRSVRNCGGQTEPAQRSNQEASDGRPDPRLKRTIT